MPKFRYTGTTDLPLDQGVVRPGDIVESSGAPGKNFVPVEDAPASESVAEPPRRKVREAAPSLEGKGE